MSKGTVKWFNTQKGFGFIQPEDGGNDVFVHIPAVERAGMSGLSEEQKVSFEIVKIGGLGNSLLIDCAPSSQRIVRCDRGTIGLTC